MNIQIPGAEDQDSGIQVVPSTASLRSRFLGEVGWGGRGLGGTFSVSLVSGDQGGTLAGAWAYGGCGCPLPMQSLL